MVALVGIAAIGTPAVFGGATTTAEATEPTAGFESYDSVAAAESQLGAADDIYLEDDGSAVLRYDEETDLNKLEMGMDVSEGLVHMLVVDDVENPEEMPESANFSAILDQQGLSGSGSLVMQQPEDLESLDVDVSGEVSEDANQFNATASGTFAGGAASTGTVSSEGHVTATADRFETSGDVSVDAGSMGVGGSDAYLDASLQETGDGYEVSVTQEQTVSSYTASQWETREQAKRTLQQQYGVYAALLGGTSQVEITNYDFDETTGRLEFDFTVTYTGIDSGLEQRLTDQLANDPTADLSRSEARAIATSVTDLDIETVSFTMDASGSTADISWDVAIANYNELTFAMLDLAEATATESQLPQEDLEQARTAIEAQQAADLETKLTWDGEIDMQTDRMTVDASVTSDTTNWAAYIDELESRGVEPPNDVTFDLTATTDGDHVSMDGSFELEAKDLAGQAFQSMAQSAQSSSTATMSPSTDDFISSLSDSELEVARIDANIADGTVRVEGGARIKNLSKITDTVSGNMAISGAATQQNGETSSLYVYVDDMGDVDTASASKSDLEHLAVVDSETTVHQAGEWDADLPDVKTEKMNRFLEAQSGDGTTSENDDSEDDGSDSIPGFGPGIGLVAIAGLLTALVLRQRE